MTNYVMDCETLINCFIVIFEDYKEDKQFTFVIHKSRNDINALIKFLNDNVYNQEWHISYNGLNFDAQIIQYILDNQETLYDNDNGESLANWLYEYAQYIIEKKSNDEFLDYSPNDFKIKQIDVFKLNHWDNPAKASSLKWIQYTTDWCNIEEMPIHHSKWIQEDEIDSIISYCSNDVKSTKHILYLSKDLISLRRTLTKEYNINLYNASEPKISKELFAHFLAQKTGIPKYELKKQRTIREKILVKDILLDYIKFNNPKFHDIYKKFKETEINPLETKNSFKCSLTHKNVKTDFGLGGLHGVTDRGIYRSNNQMVIMTSDVISFYPNQAIQNNWSPAHLPKEDFVDQYQWFFNERKKIPKSDIRNYVYKIILNSSYGLSNDKDCFLYDPEFTMRITMNGQLSLLMLYEMICEEIPQSIPLMQNTDGLETMIPVKYIDKYYEICNRWEVMTKLELEHDQYEKMIIADVNNYIAVHKEKELSFEEFTKLKIKEPQYVFTEKDGKYFYNKTKCKGRFEFKDLALHKNKSCLVIPKAIYNYFIHNIKPQETVESNKNIFDFCLGSKCKGDWEHVNSSGDKYQKVMRMFISHKGERIFRRNKVDGRTIMVIANGLYRLTPANKIDITKPFESYDINKTYYIKRIEEEIVKILPIYEPSQQLTLF